MLAKDVKKTNGIAELHVLVEQVIRFKTFNLIAGELPIS